MQSSSKNIRFLSHHDLAGNGACGEGTVLLEARGRRYLYVAHVDKKTNFSVVDVSDPRCPRLVHQEFLPHGRLRSNSLAVAGNLLLVAHEVSEPGLEPAGVKIYDVSDPMAPRAVAFFDASGPFSRGTHWVGSFDGTRAYLSTGMPDSRPTHYYDDQFPVIIDLTVPTRPEEIGRWWLPGTQRDDPEDPPLHYDLAGKGLDNGFRSHNVSVSPQRPDRAYVAYLDGGVIILDITDPGRPLPVGTVRYSPPMPGFTHTALPLVERNLLVITDETIVDGSVDFPKMLWTADMSFEACPLLIGTAPLPLSDRSGDARGRYGPHNLHENDPFPYSWQSEEFVFGSFFRGGVRGFDIRNPFQPVEIAHYVPAPAVESSVGVPQTNDLYVAAEGIIYAVDRCGGGLDILELVSL